MKGIILAGGNGSRLYPITLSTSKQLLPVYDKPMIYYPLASLMSAGIRDILVICNPGDVRAVHRLLGDGADLGVSIQYATQDQPRGIADALLVGADFIRAEPVALILGDNIFHGPALPALLQREVANVNGCVLFSYAVSDPERFGVAEVDPHGRLLSLEEKPTSPKSNRAVTGLYFFDEDAVEVARGLVPSSRGELEITDVNAAYLRAKRAKVVHLGADFAWFDSGTEDSLLAASQYVQRVVRRSGRQVGCVAEIALDMGYITADGCYRHGARLRASRYGRYVMRVAEASAAAA